MKLRGRKFPLGTLVFYGPTDQLATKAVVGIFLKDRGEPDAMRKWVSTEKDVRRDPEIIKKIHAFLREFEVQSVVVPDRILGCPHEEGIDYPDGADCPLCPFWAGRDRFTGELKKKEK